MSLSGPILWPPARENWRIGSFSSVLLLPPKNPLPPCPCPLPPVVHGGQTLHSPPPAVDELDGATCKKQSRSTLGAPTLHSDTSFLGTVVVTVGEVVNTLYCLCGRTLILKDLQMDRAETATSLTLR